MNVSTRRFANAVVLHIKGRLDQDTCEIFRGDLTKTVEGSAGVDDAVVLDLSELEYVSSAGLRCFMLASRQAKRRQVRVFVAQMQPLVAEIFQIGHFNLLFQTFPTVREALAASSSEAAAAFDKD